MQFHSSPTKLFIIHACIKEGCGKLPGSWHALRYQSTAHSILSDIDTATTSSHQHTQFESTQQTVASTWGFEEDAQNTTENSENSDQKSPSTTSLFDFSDLNRALDAMSHTTPTGERNPKTSNAKASSHLKTQDTMSANEKKNDALDSTLMPMHQKLLPSFYLTTLSSNHVKTCIPSLQGKESAESGIGDDHIRELLLRYEREQVSDASFIAAATATKTMKNNAAAAAAAVHDSKARKQHSSDDTGGDEDDDGSIDDISEQPTTWDNEPYEEDRVLMNNSRKAPTLSFLKFLKKVQLIPEQCVRSNSKSRPLMPGEMVPQPGSCSVCGRSRNFELQLMTPVIAALGESAEWLEEDGVDPGLLKKVPESWNWATILVYACGSSECCTAMYVEEEIVIVEEED